MKILDFVILTTGDVVSSYPGLFLEERHSRVPLNLTHLRTLQDGHKTVKHYHQRRSRGPHGIDYDRLQSLLDVCLSSNIDRIPRHAFLSTGSAIPVSEVHLADANRFDHGHGACRSLELSEPVLLPGFTCPTWLTETAVVDMTHE